MAYPQFPDNMRQQVSLMQSENQFATSPKSFGKEYTQHSPNTALDFGAWFNPFTRPAPKELPDRSNPWSKGNLTPRNDFQPPPRPQFKYRGPRPMPSGNKPWQSGRDKIRFKGVVDSPFTRGGIIDTRMPGGIIDTPRTRMPQPKPGLRPLKRKGVMIPFEKGGMIDNLRGTMVPESARGTVATGDIQEAKKRNITNMNSLMAPKASWLQGGAK